MVYIYDKIKLIQPYGVKPLLFFFFFKVEVFIIEVSWTFYDWE